MSTSLKSFTIPGNNAPLTFLTTAVSTICAFPIQVTRKDMTSSELLNFRYEWATFDRIWMYNYTASTLNGTTLPKVYSQYQFQSKNEQSAYINGQASHASYYSTAALAGTFDTIRV